MLVISRKAGEFVSISGLGETCRVKVVDTSRGKVRLGFEAPKNLNIVREELLTSPVCDCSKPPAFMPVPEQPVTEQPDLQGNYRATAERVQQLTREWLGYKSDGLDIVASSIVDDIRLLLEACE